MKKTLVFCLISAVFGGILAVLLIDPPAMTHHTAAQEAALPPLGYSLCYRPPSPSQR